MDRLFAILVILIIISSLFVFIKNYQDVRGAFSKELFTSFIAIYFILMLGFALLYFLLSRNGVFIAHRSAAPSWYVLRAVFSLGLF